MNLKRMTLCGVVALGLAGCPGKNNDPLPIDSSKAALTITDHTDALAESVAQSASFAGQTETMKSVNQTCSSTVNPDGTTGPEVCTSNPVDTAQPERDAAKWLKDHLFNADHVDASQGSATSVVFCFKSADVCNADPKCITELDTVPVCVKAQSFVESEYELAILVGKAPQLTPLSFSLKAGYVKAEVKLADVKASLEAIVKAGNDTLPEGFPTRLDGKVSMELAKLAEKSVSLKVAVLEAVAVDVFPATDARHSEFRVAAAPAYWSVTLDGDKKVIAADVDMKAIDLLVAAENVFGKDAPVCPPPPDVCPPPPAKLVGALMFHLDGSSLNFKFDAATAAETVSVKNIGLGDATSKVQFKDGSGAVTDIAKVDLNAAAGRRVDVTYVKKAEGAELTVTPSLALLVDHDLRVLASQLPDLKGAALKAISEIKLTGTSPAVLFRDGKSETRVEAGALELNATGMLDGMADVHVSVAAGQCTLSNPTAAPANSHPFANYVAGACTP